MNARTPLHWLASILVMMSLFFGYRLASAQSQVTTTAPPHPVVHAVMFWMDGCSNCNYVLEEILPSLQEKYGNRLQIQLIELATAENVDLLYQTAAAYQLPKEQVGVPFLIIGDQVLIGSDQITAGLPGLIETNLALVGVGYPDFIGEVNGITTPVPVAQVAAPPVPADSPAVPSWSNGFSLAIAIMVGMVGALVYSGVAFMRGTSDKASDPDRPWLSLVMPVLALIGLGVSAYLAYVETQAVQATCGPVGDCNVVQSSPYSRLFGVLPIGVLGVIGYLAILVAWLYPRLRTDRMAQIAPLLVFGMTFFGVLLSLYLTYLEPFVIRAVCIWCLTSALIMTLLLLVSLKPALQAQDSKWYSDDKGTSP
jgi:uncharacterized membrane protein